MFEFDQYRNVRKALPSAETLPSHCYTSPEFFQREINTIFESSWHFVGRTDEISEPGQFLVVDNIVGSALVCRDKVGNLSAFMNACRHRGTRLKDQADRCRKFVCPYHAWTYGLDGALRSAPGMEDVANFVKTDYGLVSVHLDEWAGFLFINYCQNPPPLVDWLGNIVTVMKGHRPEDLRCIRRMEFDINANWKFVIENALEAYHTGSVHQSTLGAQQSRSIQTNGQWDALFVESELNKSISTLPGEPQALPFISALEGMSCKGTWFTVIYPCTQIVFSQDCVWWLDIRPVSVNKSKMTLGACFPQSTIDLPEFASKVEPYFKRWSSATPEDNQIVEAQQRGHQSASISPGRFALSEHCVHRLDNWILDRVLAG